MSFVGVHTTEKLSPPPVASSLPQCPPTIRGWPFHFIQFVSEVLPSFHLTVQFKAPSMHFTDMARSPRLRTLLLLLLMLGVLFNPSINMVLARMGPNVRTAAAFDGGGGGGGGGGGRRELMTGGSGLAKAFLLVVGAAVCGVVFLVSCLLFPLCCLPIKRILPTTMPLDLLEEKVQQATTTATL